MWTIRLGDQGLEGFGPRVQSDRLESSDSAA